MTENKPKVIVICGPTASGKSSFAIELAKNPPAGGGEIISADSRQVYQGLEYFSGAVLPNEQGGITHHLLSFLNPSENFTAFDFQQAVKKLIPEILARGKTPIIVGGSSFFIESVIYQNLLPEVEPNLKLREELEKKETQELFEILQKKDPVRAEEIDNQNKRRLVRALEIVEELGKVPKIKKRLDDFYDWEVHYIKPDRTRSECRIRHNFLSRADQLLEEAEILKEKISSDRFKQLGLAFKHLDKLWAGEIDKEEFIESGISEEQKYAKRQNTFLKKFLKQLPGEVAIIRREQS